MKETGRHPLSSSIEDDWKAMQPFLEEKSACYILFRSDKENMHGFVWMLVSYVPDGSPVKQRMLYASSHALLKRQLGLSYFGLEMHGSAPDELTWDLFQQHTQTNTGDAPLTRAELQTHAELTAEIDLGRTREYVHSVAFPMSRAAADALKALSGSGNSLVQLSLDTEKETLELAADKSVTAAQLGGEIPADEPRFSFFRFDHTFEARDMSPVVFVYSCTDNAPIKQRMLYSTVKAAAVDAAAGQGVSIAKKLEVSDGSEVTEAGLLEELHPVAREISTKTQFARPARPSRGGRPRTRPTRK
eukprot:TRINITY_DN3412_c0_g2_i1.p2 TRINITY_DN3412_c0_g2~~TRINITY_DN3412_c0_g2_i1.p2  ORF type:complete len:347 (-),score=98.56 TRINITY_DN3412_c0_g2_i1:94-999(-)